MNQSSGFVPRHVSGDAIDQANGHLPIPKTCPAYVAILVPAGGDKGGTSTGEPPTGPRKSHGASWRGCHPARRTSLISASSADQSGMVPSAW